MKKFYLFFFLISLNFISFSQNLGDIAQSFGYTPGFGSSVNEIATQADGKILVGGGFTTYQGVTENYIIRLNTDGTKDTAFNTSTGFNNIVYAIATQADGKILVGGDFTTYNGVTENRIIRLNADGSKDTAFNTGTGLNYTVYAIETQADGKILVAGSFTSYNGVTGNNIIRLNADGSKDTSFSTGIGFNSPVLVIATQSDGKILVGGSFTTYNGITENYIVRLNADGSKDTTYSTETGFTGSVRAIVTQADGKILLGGSFTSFSGVTGNRIIRLNADGSKDTAFSTGTGFNGSVMAIATQADGKILVGGEFTTYNGVNGTSIIRLNADGSKDTAFSTGTGLMSGVNEIATQADGKILVGGEFNTYNSVTVNRIIRLNADSTIDTAFSTGTGYINTVFAIATQADGKILVGGAINTYNNVTENRIIRLNADGSKDTSFITGTGFDSTTVNTIVVQPDGKILVGGGFGSYNGITQFYIIRLNIDGSVDSSFNTGAGFINGGVNEILLQTDGKILVGGGFTSFNGITENYIIRLNTNGSRDNTFNTGTGFNADVLEIKKQLDGKILVGGVFTSYNGTTENRIIRLNTDGSKDTSFDTGTGFDEPIYTIEPQTDGKILVGGSFTSYNGTNKNSIIRLNTNGTIDTSFNIQSGLNYILVSNIETQTDEKIMISGNYSSLNGSSLYGIIRFYSDGTIDTAFNNGFDSAIVGVSEVENGTFYAWGGYYTYNNNSSSSFFVKLYYDANLSNENITNPEIILLYPNPAKEIINVGLLNQALISNVKIYNLQGKLIQESKDKTIDVSNFSKGLYVIKVVTEEGEFTKKFIKE